MLVHRRREEEKGDLWFRFLESMGRRALGYGSGVLREREGEDEEFPLNFQRESRERIVVGGRVLFGGKKNREGAMKVFFFDDGAENSIRRPEDQQLDL